MPRVQRFFLILLIAAVFVAAAGCTKPKDSGETGSAESVQNPTPANVNKDDYPVFPNADAGSDAAVPADQGGKGFTGQGWQTNTSFNLIGDPRAVKGGLYREYIPDFPDGLRLAGPGASTNTNSLIGDSLYETLVSFDPTTLDYIPSLATHWKISDDKLTFQFRINPNARFSNGEPVTAEDVVASWVLVVDKAIQDPSRYKQFAKFQRPVAESKYIVRVKALNPDWRNFKDFATALLIYPSGSLKNLTGAAYLEKYNFTYLPGTGPYAIGDADIQKGKSLSMRRRKDYWGEKARRNVGLNNFDEIRLVVVLDPSLAFEMFKKGDLDFFYVNQSRVWVKGMDFDAVQRGLIQKRRVFNRQPGAFQGFAMNTRRPPFDNLQVRKAFALLLDRQKMIEQLFENEYMPLNTYFPGSVYENPENPKNLYSPQEALKLLAEAGWKDRDAQGRLVKAGKPLVVQMLYDGKNLERVLTVFQDDVRKVGITMDLKFVPFETRVQLVRGDRQFDMVYAGFGMPAFPDPEADWHSSLADVKNNNNITGFKDPAMDDLMAKYAASADSKERIELIRKLDGLMANQYHYALQWTAPFLRLAFWNKFGQPAGYVTRTGDYLGDMPLGPGAERLWWVDPAKEERLSKAIMDSSMKLGVGPAEDRYWLEVK